MPDNTNSYVFSSENTLLIGISAKSQNCIPDGNTKGNTESNDIKLDTNGMVKMRLQHNQKKNKKSRQKL